MRTVRRSPILAVLSLSSLFALSACSRGGAPVVPDEPQPSPDLSGTPAPPDLGGGDGGPGPVEACESPCWLDPLPQGNYLSGAWLDSSGNGWAVGATSLVRITGDKLKLFRHPAWKENADLESVWGSGPSDVWIAGSAVLHYDGTSWTAVDAFAKQGFQDVWGSGPGDVWLVGITGRIRHYDGSTWSEVPSGTTLSLRTVTGTGPTDAWAAGQGGLMLRWNGTAWRQVSTPVGREIISVSCAHTNDCWALVSDDMYAFSGKTLIRWDGARWTQVTGTPTGTFYSVTALGANEVWLAGASTYRFDGTTWIVTTQGLTNILFEEVAVSRGSERIGVGIHGTIARWDGSKWTRLSSGSGENLFAAWVGPAGEVWIAGAYKSLARFSNNRLEWMTPPDTFGTCFALWGSGSRDVWAVSEYGKITRFDGTDWKDVPSGTSDHLRAVAGSGPSDIWVAGDHGTLLHYDGTRFSTVDSSLTGGLLSLWVSGPGDAWLGSEEGGLARWNGSKWTAWPTRFMRDINALWGSSPNNVWASGGKKTATSTSLLLRFDGTTWTEQTAPAGMYRQNVLWGSGPNEIWSGGIYGDLWRWNGAAWQKVPIGSGFEVHGLAGSGRNLLLAGDSMLLRLDR